MTNGRTSSLRTRFGAALMLTGLLTGLLAIVAPSAQAAAVTGGTVGGFVIDGTQDGGNGTTTIDWADVASMFTPLIDKVSPDDGLKGSSKEDDPEDFVCQNKTPTVTPGKDNLVRAYINTHLHASDVFLDLAFVRSDGGTQGDSHVNFEFNQNPISSLCPYTTRATGDLLITFDFPGNSSDPADVQTFLWDEDAPDGSNPIGKWMPFDFTGSVAAEDNVTTITDHVVSGTIAPRAFGEASLDLTELIAQTTGDNSCRTFGFASIRSRSSGQSFESALQDIMGGPVNVDTCGNIHLEKSGPTTATIGEEITYTFDVTTTRPVPITITSLTEVVDPDHFYADRCDAPLTVPVEITGNGDAYLDEGELWQSTCTHVVTEQDASDGDGVLLQNKAIVTGEDSRGNEVSDEDTHTVTIDLPGVGVEKTTSTPEVNAGDGVAFSITLTNDGEAAATGVSFTDNLPGGVTWTSVNELPKECSLTDNVLECTDLTVPAGESVTFELSGTSSAADCPSITNEPFTITVPNEPEDLAGDNTTQPVTITVNCPDLTVTKSTDTPSVNAGSAVGFDITITNNGPGTATNVTFADDLPNSVVWSFDGEPPVGCTLTQSNDLACSFEELTPGSVQVSLVGTTDTGDCPSITNPASSVSADNEPRSATENNSTDPVTITVTCPPPPPPPPPPPGTPGINIVKDGPASATVGQSVTFTFTVTNVGEVPLSNVTVTDDKCAPVTYVSGDTDLDEQLDLTETWSYTCTRAVVAADVPSVTNTATATGKDALGTTVQDTDTHTLGVSQVAGEVVTPPVVEPAALPRTGVDSDALLLLSGLLLLLGGVLVASGEGWTLSQIRRRD